MQLTLPEHLLSASEGKGCLQLPALADVEVLLTVLSFGQDVMNDYETAAW